MTTRWRTPSFAPVGQLAMAFVQSLLYIAIGSPGIAHGTASHSDDVPSTTTEAENTAQVLWLCSGSFGNQRCAGGWEAPWFSIPSRTALCSPRVKQW